MIKVMLFVKRKDGLTREQFRDRYESGHVPLAVSELPWVRRYVRNYFKPVRGLPEPEFDVVTEFWFADWEAWKANSAWCLDPVTGRTLVDDEAEFMDRASMRIIVVEEEVTDVDAMRAAAAGGAA